jgi:hypothetical protein
MPRCRAVFFAFSRSVNKKLESRDGFLFRSLASTWEKRQTKSSILRFPVLLSDPGSLIGETF